MMPMPVGPQIDGYEILGELGRGAMGVVYKARHLRLDRLVALKMILAESYAGAEERRRFLAEAEAVARLNHPNIVAIYDINVQHQRPYFSLEFVEGGTLQSRIAGVPQNPRAAARLVETIARGIHAAHQSNIVHRDLKPANILLTAQGVPKVTDFGIAKHTDARVDVTGSSMVVGTPQYMSPEQADGRSHRANAATDVYGLGAVLYAMLTGRPPFDGSSAVQVAFAVVHRDPVRPRQLVPDIPVDLETICLKCLAKNPQARYGTAAELADDLHRYLSGEPIKARPVGAVEQAVRWVRRNPSLAIAGSMASLGLAATALLGVWYGQSQSRLVRDLADREARLTAAVADAENQRRLAQARSREAQQRRDEAQELHARAEKLRAEAQAQAQQAHIAAEQARLGLKLVRWSTSKSQQVSARVAYLVGTTPALAGPEFAPLRQLISASFESSLAGRTLSDMGLLDWLVIHVAYDPKRQTTLAGRLDAQQHAVDQLAARQPNTPKDIADLAQSRLVLAALVSDSGRHSQAVALARQAHGELAQIFGGGRLKPESSLSPLALAHLATGMIQFRSSDYLGAMPLLEQAVEQSRQAATDLASRLLWGYAERIFADELFTTGRLDEALRRHGQLRQRLVALSDEFPNERTAHSERQLQASSYASILSLVGEWPQAMQIWDDVIQQGHARCQREPDRPELLTMVAVTYHDRALLYQRLEKIDEARDEARQALELWTKLAGHYPQRAIYRARLEDIQQFMASLGRSP